MVLDKNNTKENQIDVRLEMMMLKNYQKYN